MDPQMKVDSRKIRTYREQRAWSQEHLAQVAGLGLRTVQRIETTGAASYESARALAAAFRIDVAELRVENAVIRVAPRRSVLSASLFGVVTAALAGVALFVTTALRAEQVSLDIDWSFGARSVSTEVVLEEGQKFTSLRMGPQEPRFTLVPRLLPDGKVLLELEIFGADDEVPASQPQLVTAHGEDAEVIFGAPDGQRLRVLMMVRREQR